MTTKPIPLDTGHPCVRFIKEFTFNPIMDTQANLFRYLNQQETDSSQTIAYPLVDEAKKRKKEYCKQCNSSKNDNVISNV